MLITENATLKADLRHLKEDLGRLNETTVTGLERDLKQTKDALSQERAKLEKHLKNEARSARNRETNSILGASNAVKRELMDRENSQADDDVPDAEITQPNVENLVHAINIKAETAGPSATAHEHITEDYVPAKEQVEENA
ncbi:hypothetical protein AAVH_43431, partial [Aphelenchoides avenae]